MTKYHFLKWIALSTMLAFAACKETVTITNSSYTGTGSVTQGAGTTTTANLFPSGVRVAALGTITSTDNKTWALPADVNFTNAAFPFASDLYNSYVSEHGYANSSTATAALSSSNIVTVDAMERFLRPIFLEIIILKCTSMAFPLVKTLFLTQILTLVLYVLRPKSLLR